MHELRRIGVLIAMLAMTSAVTVLAQEERDTSFRWGVWAAASLDLHDASFSKFTEVGYCCPSDFGAQTGFGAQLGGLLRFTPLAKLDRRLLLDLRLSAGYHASEFTSTEQTLFNDPSNGSNESVEASFDYVISPSWMTASIDIMPSYRIISGLTAQLGVRAGMVFGDSYEQTERITSEFADLGFVFTDTKTPERNVASSSIPGIATLQWSLLAGLTWEFALNKEGTLFLAPEVFYAFGLSQISDGVSHADGSAGSWNMSSIQGGISLRFASAPTIKPDPCDTIINGELVPKTCPERQVLVFDAETNTCFCRDTTTVVDSVIVRIDTVRGVTDSDGAAGPSDIVVESFKVRHWVPTLPFIFFDQGSAEIDLADRYRDISPQTRMSFDVEPSFQRDITRHVLNIIGKRLFQEPDATIEIIGQYGSGTDENDALSRDRAFAVRDYLYQRWSVGFDRMTVSSGSARKLEASADPSEARAVEIRTNTPVVLAPVEMPETTVTVRPSKVRISATIQPGAGRDIASITYGLRLGGGSGRRPKPLTETFNVGDPAFTQALHSWTADVGAADGRILDAVKGQLDATDLVLLPSLDVTFTNGQKTAAEQDVRKTTLAMPTLTPETKRAQRLTDTVELILDVLFPTTGVDTLDAVATTYLGAVLSTLPQNSTAKIMQVNSAMRDSRREAVRLYLQSKGLSVVDDNVSAITTADTSDPRSSTYNRVIRVRIRVPITGG